MTDSDPESDSSISGTATYIKQYCIKYCFFIGHVIYAYVCSIIYHSSLLRYCLLCALFQPLVVSKLTHWILDIFSAAVSHGLSILGTKRKFGGHILKLRFLI